MANGSKLPEATELPCTALDVARASCLGAAGAVFCAAGTAVAPDEKELKKSSKEVSLDGCATPMEGAQARELLADGAWIGCTVCSGWSDALNAKKSSKDEESWLGWGMAAGATACCTETEAKKLSASASIASVAGEETAAGTAVGASAVFQSAETTGDGAALENVAGSLRSAGFAIGSNGVPATIGFGPWVVRLASRLASAPVALEAAALAPAAACCTCCRISCADGAYNRGCA